MKKFKLFKALMLIVSIMLISPQVWGETCATMAKSGWDKLSSTNRKYELGTGFYIYDCNSSGDTIVYSSTKYGNSIKINKDNTKGYAISDKRLLMKFPEKVSSITIYGYGNTARTLFSIKTNSYLTGSSSDRTAHPWSSAMTPTTDYTTSASKDANDQQTITINFVSGHEPDAEKYIWIQLSNGLAMYRFCYTSASTAKYSLAYDANGGTGSMPAHDFVSGTTVYAGQNAGFTPPTGKIFKCWNTKANGSGTEYKEGDSFTLNANTTLYAQWITASTSSTYCISMYNLNVSDQMKYFTWSGYDDMQILDLEVPNYKTDDDNNFWVGAGGSWKSGNLGNSGASSANEKMKELCLKGNRGQKLGTGSQGVLARFFIYDNSTYNNLYIEFTPKQYSLIWGPDGSSWSPVKLYPSGYENEWTSEVVTLTSDQISSYNYYVGILKADNGVAYWYKSNTLSVGSMGTYNKRTDTWGGNVSTLSAGAKGFFRMWQDATSYDNWRCHFVPVYTLSYNANSGSGAPANAYVATEGDAAARTLKVSMTEPTRNGYSFEGWATSSANASAGTVAYDPGDNITLSADVELWAVWTCVDPTIGTDLSESQVDYNVGDAATALSVAATAAGGTVSYQWYSNTAKSTSSPTPTSLTTGTSYTPSTAADGTTYYFCKMTNSTAGCSNVVYSKIAKVVVSRVNPTQYTVSGTASICAGGNTDITLSGSQVGASYQLKIGGVATGDPKAGTGSALTWNVSTTGTYTVSAVQTTKYLARDMSGSATVSAKTATSVSFSNYTLDATVDEEFEITGISAAGDGTLTYQWYSYSDAEGNGEAEIGGAESSTYTFTPDDETDYYFKCEVTGTCGSVKSNMIIVTATDVVTYTVTYDDNGADSGTAPTDSYSPYESEATVTVLGNTGSLAKAFVAVSATFLGWNTNSDTYSGTHYDAGDEFSITENTTLYPVWGYSISYSTDGGTINDASYSTYYICTYPDEDVTTSLPSDVTKEGYTFDGWKTENGNGTIITEIDGGYVGSFSGEYALKAMWTLNAYHVTYAGNGNTGGTVPTNSTDYAGDGTETVTVAGNTGSLVKTGYTFRGWSDGTTFFLGGQSFEMPAANVTLTAVWEPNSVAPTTIADIDFTDETTASLTGSGETKTVDDFDIYFKGIASITNGTGAVPSGNMSSNNNYLAIPLSGINGSISFTITGANRPQLRYKIIEYDALPDAIADPSSYTGIDRPASGSSVTVSDVKVSKSYAVLYLGQSSSSNPVGTVTITTPGAEGHFDVSFKDGETAPASHITWPSDIVGVEDGLMILAPSTTPSATGYTYGGWYTNAKCTLAVNYGTMTITADTKIYAKWTPKTTSVTLDANTANHGSTGSSVTATYDSALPSFSPATPSGAYVLEGYYTTASGEGVKIINADGTLVSETTSYTADGLWKSVESSLTLYARYVTAYQVTYNDNGKTGGGAAPSDATYYASGAEVTVAGNTNSMTKTNCVFMGWNTAADGTGTTYMGGEKMTMPSENTTLYALWGVSLTWNVQVNVAETTVTTSSTASSYTTHVANPSDLALNDLTVTSDAKSTATNKISTTKAKGGYISATFAVASGYQFTPTHMVLKTTAISEAKTIEVNVGSESQTWNQPQSGSSPDEHIYKFADASAITGTGTMKIYAYGGSNGTKGYRLGTPITVYGKVEPCTYTITYKDKGDVDFSGSHTDSPSAHPTSHTYGSATTLNSATKTGYTFGGWFDNADCDGDAVTILGATAVTSNVTLYAKWNPVTLTFTGNGSGVKWDWKDATNWTPACIPTIEHDVIIQKPVEVSMYGAGNIAKAKSIVIDKNGDNTGRLVVKGPYGLAVAGTIQMKNEEGNFVAPESADLRIESTSYYENGALAVKGFTEASEKDINATVIYYTKSHVVDGWTIEGEYDGFYLNQFIGTPLRTSNIYDYYGCWIYKWDPTADDGKGDWKYESTSMTPFQGYDILNDLPASPSYWLTGPLVYSDDQELDLTFTGLGGKNGSENMFANSWMAPIDVTKFRTTDFAGGDETKMEATIYVFNSGTPNNWAEKEDLEGTYPGQFLIMTPLSGAYTGGISEIQSMQAFSVYAKDEGATLTLNYDRLVYQPLLNRSTPIDEMRAPRRAKAESELDAPEIMRIRVKGEQSADKIHLLIRDDFSEGFDNGWDASKMFGMSFAPQLYVITGTGKELSINCTPDAEGTILGFRKGEKDSVYTFTFEYDGAEIFYLNDLKAQTSTLISAESTYEFTAEADDAEARFIISATPIVKVATGVEQTSGNTQDAKVRKVIINDHVYIIRGGRMYSVEGTMLK